MNRFLTDQQIGEKIKEARLAKGWTQAELASRLGVGQTAVGKWEKGVVTNIKRTMMQKIGEALNISPLLIIGILPQDNKVITVRKDDFTPSVFSRIEKHIESAKAKRECILITQDEFTASQFEQIKNFIQFIKGSK